MASKPEAKAIEYKTTALGRAYIQKIAGGGDRLEQLLREFALGGCTLDEARKQSEQIVKEHQKLLETEEDAILIMLSKQVIRCHEDVLKDIDKLFAEAVSKGYLEKI
jgi:ElaB/YqjD/DUF883 family membrane-anchored ribosome-binding protein